MGKRYVFWRDSTGKPHKSLPYGSEGVEILKRYAMALDQSNMDVAFLHLWGILEKITQTVGTSYDETVKRAVRTFSDRALAGELLEAMRLHRNRIVHAAHAGEERDQVVYLIKGFVDPHLLRLIRNDFQVESLQEYGDQLRLPTDLKELRRRHRLVSQAIRIARNETKRSGAAH